MRRLILGPLVVVTLILAACSSSGGSAPATTSAGGGASATAASDAGGGAASAGGAAGACAAAPAGASAAETVTIKNFAFAPQPVEAKVGDVVTWTNEDGSTPHSATMDNGACDTKTINGGSSASLVFTAPGTYTYHCSIHPTQMKDYTIVVK
jgi:plastocyanin